MFAAAAGAARGPAGIVECCPELPARPAGAVASTATLSPGKPLWLLYFYPGHATAVTQTAPARANTAPAPRAATYREIITRPAATGVYHTIFRQGGPTQSLMVDAATGQYTPVKYLRNVWMSDAERRIPEPGF